ncbi:MAG TPA: PilN domain-containing protein, partial [Gemmatirosa sp.]
SPVRVLADIARTLPAGAAIVDVQLDGAEGRLVAVAPHAATVVAALARVPTLDDVEVVGPVTRDEAPPTSAAISTMSAPMPAPMPATMPAPMPAPMPAAPGDAAAGSPATERVAVRFRVLAPRSGPDARSTGAPMPAAPPGRAVASVRPAAARS